MTSAPQDDNANLFIATVLREAPARRVGIHPARQ